VGMGVSMLRNGGGRGGGGIDGNEWS
jgi:hypothetical protein